jgi:hypothetical protein
MTYCMNKKLLRKAQSLENMYVAGKFAHVKFFVDRERQATTFRTTVQWKT